MSFEKRTYTAYETTITADNLNAMQDELIALREDKYEKPAGGMPKTDLSSGVQTSLGKADTALQPTDVDSALSQTSTNPVQNKVVTAALGAKADESDLLKAFPTGTASGSIASFPDGADGLPVKDMLVNIDPVQSGSGDPSGTNIRPISGHAGCNVTVAGKNLSPVATLASHTGNHTAINVSMKAGVQYRISFTQSGSGAYTTIYFYKDSTLVYTSVSSQSLSRSITLPEDANKIVFNSGATARAYANIMLRLAGTASAFESYIGNTAQITFPETVFAGVLYPLTGELRTRPYYASYNGEILVGPWISDRDVYTAGASPTIGAQVVDLGGAETVYQISAATVASLLGVNNIWADTGDVSVEYRADPTLYIAERESDIQSAIAPIENGSTASQAYSQGAYFFRNGDFCKAKTAIASGAAFTLNTNYEPTTVAVELFAALNP